MIDNNALDVPSNTASVRPGAGIGVDLLGSYGDLITGNLIAGNRNVGLLGLQVPLLGRARFALAGNRISGNRINGARLAIALAATAGSSNNCLQGNLGGPVIPADSARFACKHKATPSLPVQSSHRILALVDRLHAQLAGHARQRQPAPPPQPTMPTPCQGAPPTLLCPR